MKQKNDDRVMKRKEDNQPLASGKPKRVKQKHVGDETPNPLPDDDTGSKQPAGDTTEASPEEASSIA